MACESEKKEVKAAKDAYDKIHKYNQVQYIKKMKEQTAANKRVIAANTALSRCRSKDPAGFDSTRAALTKRLQSESVSTKKTGGFRDEWLEPKCCPEI